ncbi:MAG: DUF935 family protein [Sulfuricellaceae bacterium]|nr:DUF935 family protein [Sulfuricellaceae bacterium]
MKIEKQEIATTLDGRDITRGMTDPLRLELPDDSVLMQRGGGDYTIYREVLRDDHVKAALEQRFRAVIARPWEVKPGGKRAIDKAAADFLSEQLKALRWDAITEKMLYGVFYGHAVAEVLWEPQGNRVGIKDIKVRDRRRFGYDGAMRLRLKTLASPQGELLPDAKFWHFATGADHDDAPYGLGLAHWLYWPVWLKRNGMKFWAVFLEKFGTPTGLGHFPPGTSQADQSRLLSALQAIQRDSAIILPEGMEAKLLEATRGGTADHAAFVSLLNAAILVVSIGQTASTQGTPGKLGNDKEQGEVREDIVKADADLICMSFNATVVKWLTEYNFPGAALPQVWRNMEEEEDLNARSEREDKIQAWGFKPAMAHIKDVYGGEWEERQQTAISDQPSAKPVLLKADKLKAESAVQAAFADTPDLQGQAAMDDQTATWLESIQAMLDGADSLEEFRARLIAAYPDMDRNGMVAAMSAAFAAAHLSGMSEVVDETATTGHGKEGMDNG